MKKWILIGLGAVVVMVAVVLAVGISKLGPLVKLAVNTYGPDITRTELRVDDVGISLFSAEAKLKRFFLGNPEGFKSPSAVQVGSIYVDVDQSTLAKDTIVIKTIEVVAPDITFEKRGKSDNFKTILNNVQKSMPAGESSKQNKETKGPGKQLIINDFIVQKARLNLAVVMPGGLLGDQEVQTDLPDIHLKDIGKKKGGASPAEVAGEIFNALYARVTDPKVMSSLNHQLEKLNLPGMAAVGKTTKMATEAAADAGEKAGALGGKVKGLLKSKD
jgi:uncharacterized protein involved in outer membrane biogenesis